MEILLQSPKETKELASKVAKNLKPGDILALYGDLGSGKTTFTRFLVEALGFSSRVQSPTFIVARRYTKDSEGIKVINHIDLYRLHSKEEVSDLGLSELFNEDEAITIIEWPELLEEILPKTAKKFCFEYLEEGVRKVIIKS